MEKNPTPLTNPEVLSVLKERIESASAESTGALTSEQEVNSKSNLNLHIKLKTKKVKLRYYFIFVKAVSDVQ